MKATGGIGLLLLLLSGCSAVAVPSVETTVSSPTPTPTSSVVAALRDWRPEARSDDPGGWPCYYDPAATAPFGCTVFVSTGGEAAGVAMTWLSTSPVRLQVTPPLNPSMDNGADLALGIATPCNSLSLPVARDGDTLTMTTGPITSLMGCLGTESQAERWVTEFVERPMQFTSDGRSLVMTSGEDTIRFTDVAAF